MPAPLFKIDQKFIVKTAKDVWEAEKAHMLADPKISQAVKDVIKQKTWEDQPEETKQFRLKYAHEIISAFMRSGWV